MHREFWLKPGCPKLECNFCRDGRAVMSNSCMKGVESVPDDALTGNAALC